MPARLQSECRHAKTSRHICDWRAHAGEPTEPMKTMWSQYIIGACLWHYMGIASELITLLYYICLKCTYMTRNAHQSIKISKCTRVISVSNKYAQKQETQIYRLRRDVGEGGMVHIVGAAYARAVNGYVNSSMYHRQLINAISKWRSLFGFYIYKRLYE